MFLKIKNHCDMGNTYLCLGGCFLCVLRVFHKYFEGAAMCFKGASGCFCQKGLLMCAEVKAATNANSIGQKQPKTTLGPTII